MKAFPDFSDGVLALLRIARENDAHDALANNTALYSVLDFGKACIEACRAGQKAGLLKWLDVSPPPPHFLALCAAILQWVRKEQDAQFLAGEASSAIPVVTDFDRHVLQGFAEALADVAWPERDASEFNGPSLEVCAARLAGHEPRDLWLRTIQHYLANILQHYFAAARIREQVQDLPLDTEAQLRLRDARLLAEYVMANSSTPDAAKVLGTLRAALVSIR